MRSAIALESALHAQRMPNAWCPARLSRTTASLPRLHDYIQIHFIHAAESAAFPASYEGGEFV
jgi:hypothetical protein